MTIISPMRITAIIITITIITMIIIGTMMMIINKQKYHQQGLTNKKQHRPAKHAQYDQMQSGEDGNRYPFASLSRRAVVVFSLQFHSQ